MRYFYISLLVVLLIISFVACTAVPIEKAPSPTPEATSEPIPSPTPTPIPKPIPAPTPTEEQLTPEEIEQNKIKKEVEILKGYYEKYTDEYALCRIKEFYESGKLMKDDYYNEVNKIINEMYPNSIREYLYYSSLLNGRMEEIDIVSFGYFLDALVSNARRECPYFSLFDHQKQRDRVEEGIKIVDKWINEPTDENTKALEELITSVELTDEEKVFLFRWNEGRTNFNNISRNGKVYDYETYTDGVIIDEENNKTYLDFFFEVQDILFERNNTPNSDNE